MADNIFEQAIEAILKGDADRATEIAKKGLDEGMDPLELMDKGFIPGINQVGDLFETGRLFLPAGSGCSSLPPPTAPASPRICQGRTAA